MAESVKTVSIVPLKGSNYATWKVQCTMALKKDGVWSIVDGTEIAPGHTAAEKERERYKSRKDKALAIIVLSVDPSLLYLVGADPEDPVVVWNKLKEQFQKKSWVNRLNLRRKLHSLKLKDSGSVQDHVKTMMETFHELSVVGDAVNDDDKVVFLLASLPESYTTLVTALEASATVPAMDVVIEKLLHEERKHKERDESQSDGAYTAKSRSRSRGPRCYGCQKIGHIQRNCPERARSLTEFKSPAEQSYKPGKKPKPKGSNHQAHSTKTRSKESKNSDSDDSVVGLVTGQLLSATTSNEVGSWIVDSGATSHLCNDKSMFTVFDSLENPQEIVLGDGHTLDAVGVGDVVLNVVVDGKIKKRRLRDVLYVPRLAYNLLSVSKTTETGKKIKFGSDGLQFLDCDGRVVAVGVKKGSLYYLTCHKDTDTQVHMSDAQSMDESRESIWHRRFGHLNERSLRTLASRSLVNDFNYNASSRIPFCESCVKGKLHRKPFGTSERQVKVPLELVHSDVCGPLSSESLGGAKYFVTFIDARTHYTWVYFLKSKDEVFSKFLEWKSLVERMSDYRLKTLRTDNGGEYTSGEFSKYLRTEGIRHELTVPKTPEQNGVAERFNRTLVECVRAVLSDAHLSHSFWAEALSTVVYVRNRSYSSAVSGMTPYQAWSGNKPSVGNLRIFGCTAYSHIPKDERKKLDSKARKCIFLGYGEVTKGYRLYDPVKRRVIHSRDVIFDESTMGTEEKEPIEDAQSVQIETNEDNKEEHDDNSEELPLPRRSERTRRRPDYYGEWTHMSVQRTEPTTIDEVLSSSDKDLWEEAMQKEMKSIEENDVWDIVELPKGKKAVGCRWVYKKKIGSDGSIERYKARLVAKGYSQQYGQDYDETFSPVVRFESLRTLLALSVQDGLCVQQLDITTAFLNGELQEEVYMEQPEGFKVRGKEGLVCRLKHSLYGLKQAPRCELSS